MHWIVSPNSMGGQIFWLLMLAVPIACIARTIVFEEIFKEPRNWCMERSEKCRSFFQRKFFYLFTCEYCFSHYITGIILLMTDFKLLFNDWRGYVLSFFALVLVANAYLNLYSRLRIDITHAKVQTKMLECEVEQSTSEMESGSSKA